MARRGTGLRSIATRGAVAIGAIGAGVGAALAAYLGLGWAAYARMTRAAARCDGRFASYTPAAFGTEGVSGAFSTTLDMRPYAAATFEDVAIPSRTPGVTLAAWCVPPSVPSNGRAVVLVHGYSSCRRDPVLLLPAGMLGRNGFTTLLVDLRDHGDSTVVDGRWAGGADEFWDVLGAWDWIVAGRGFDAASVAVFGASMGAGATLIAVGEEPRIAAAWIDCGFADIHVAIREELRFRRMPLWVAPAGLRAARLFSGLDLTARSPIGGARRLGGRPLGIAHGEADTHAPLHHAFDLAAAARATGSRVDLWTIPEAEHNQGMFMVPDDYERRLVDFLTRALAPTASHEAPTV